MLDVKDIRIRQLERQVRQLVSEKATLEAKNKILMGRADEIDADLECLPEDQSVTETVEALRQERDTLSAQLAAVGEWQRLNEKLIYPIDVHEWQELDAILTPAPKALETNNGFYTSGSGFSPLRLFKEAVPAIEVILQKGGSHE